MTPLLFNHSETMRNEKRLSSTRCRITSRWSSQDGLTCSRFAASSREERDASMRHVSVQSGTEQVCQGKNDIREIHLHKDIHPPLRGGWMSLAASFSFPTSQFRLADSHRGHFRRHACRWCLLIAGRALRPKVSSAVCLAGLICRRPHPSRLLQLRPPEESF